MVFGSLLLAEFENTNNCSCNVMILVCAIYKHRRIESADGKHRELLSTDFSFCLTTGQC